MSISIKDEKYEESEKYKMWLFISSWCLKQRVSPFDSYWYNKAKEQFLLERKENG